MSPVSNRELQVTIRQCDCQMLINQHMYYEETLLQTFYVLRLCMCKDGSLSLYTTSQLMMI